MKKTTIVAFMLLISNALLANSLTPEINNIESQWASIYYKKSIPEQRKAYPSLLMQTEHLSDQYPNAIEPIIWKAIIIATNAAYESPFAALESLDTAKELLEQAIQHKPNALDGAAYVTLGTLYYMTPGWPISYGDKAKAGLLLKKALTINPNSIDANYFYADYLLTNNQITDAEKYFKLALKAPSRTQQLFADTQLKKEASLALKQTKQRKLNTGKNKFLSLFYNARTNQLSVTKIIPD